MGRGRISKPDMEAKLYKLKNELHKEWRDPVQKDLANQYLNRVLDFINEFNG